MKENYLEKKSLIFAGEIINVYKRLISDFQETVISKQILKSGTSIGANINEANYAQSRLDFISKLQIALKETAETEYWLRVLHYSQLIDEETFSTLLEECLEIKRLLISSVNTAKSKLPK